MTRPILLAYSDHQSVRPGESIAFKVSCEGAPSYRAEIVRLRAPNVGPGPDVPAFDFEVLDAPLNGDHPAIHQPIHRGSYVRVDADYSGTGAFTLCATIHPTRTKPETQTILGTASVGRGRMGLALQAGFLVIVRQDGSVFDSRLAVPQDRWVFTSVAYDGETFTFRVLTLPSRRHEPAVWEARTLDAPGGLSLGAGPLVIAADLVPAASGGEAPQDCFNGRIERPRVFPKALTQEELFEVLALGPTASADGAVGDWDFSQGIAGERVVDTSGHGADGDVSNLPTRAVGGSNWSGTTSDWRSQAGEYGAIHFHDDDLLEAGWQTTCELVVPDDWPSGLYAGRFQAAEATFWVPFAVRAPVPRSDVVFLLPTATYAAYANLRMRVTAQVVELMQGRLTVLDDTDLLLLDQSLGLSTYDAHSDGSTVVHATMRQPVTNFRPEGRIYKFCQDMLIVSWLEHEGIDYEVITDEDLDREGVAAIEPYRVLVTGSHPEYVSTRMLDAIDDHVRSGGRLMYIGGNGFYSRIAFHPEITGVVEVRRPDNPKLWAADAAQGHHAFTGEMAGTWSGIGRPPQLLTGVGFITQGFDASSYYRRSAASSDDRAGFIFEGIEDELIGDFGLLQGGAAGFEIDRADPGLGTPAHALVLASSEGHSNIFDLVLTSIEDRLPVVDPDGLDRIRADLVFFETEGGGAVFSVGSIAWSGSLAHNGYDNNVAQVSRNVLRRFADPVRFEAPGVMAEGGR